MRNSAVSSKRATAPSSGGGSGISISSGYEAVAASQTSQVLGGAGATGDFLDRILIVPATTAPGAVTVYDNASAILSYAGGSAPTVEPFEILFGVFSVNGAWKITTGANVSVLAFGSFT